MRDGGRVGGAKQRARGHRLIALLSDLDSAFTFILSNGKSQMIYKGATEMRKGDIMII